MFEKGNKVNLGRKNPHAGRKKKLSTVMKEALRNVDANIDVIFQALIDKALEGDREAQIYLIDRRLGKPKQAMELEVEKKVTAADMVQIYQLMEKPRKLLEGGKYAERTSENKLSEGVYEEAEGSNR